MRVAEECRLRHEGAFAMRALHRSVRLLLAAIVVFSTFVLVPSVGAAPTTWWVDIATGNNVNPGTEAQPFRTITAGLTHAASGDTVLVRPGTYGVDPEQTFPIAFPAGVRLQSTDGADETKIVGPGTGDVIRITNATAGTTVLGFTITDTGASGQQGFRIVRNAAGSVVGWPRVAECVIESCGNISSTGGGMYIEGVVGTLAQPRIEDTEFRDNIADEGGGVYVGAYTRPMILSCLFENNSAYRGGGMCTRIEDEVMLYWCDFIGNSADVGGGVSAVSGGGGLYIYGGRLAGNNASVRGGGIELVAYNANIDSVAISENTSNDGAGLYTDFSNPTLSNCLVTGNTANIGAGAAFVAHGTLTVNNCTVADNTGVEWPSIYAYTGGSGGVEVYNSIFWGHGGFDLNGASAIQYTDTQDTNLADNGNVGVVNVMHSDPLFVNDPTDYRLMPNSPCIDAADPGFVVVEDFYGYVRPADGDGDGTAVPDMGYAEYLIPADERISGADRYQTAAELATSMWTTNKVAVVVSGENYPDALSAASLAGAHGCPILLVRPDSVPASTAAALTDLGTEEVILVGGPAAVKETVVIEIANTVGPVERVYGEDRYATSAEVARVLAAEEGVSFSKTALIARGDSFPDALALSPLAYRGSQYHAGLPILLTRPDALSPPTALIIDELGIDHAFIAGGLTAVSAGVKDDIDAALVAHGGTDSTRWSGADRYATAVAIAEGGVMQRWARWDRVSVATGTNFPDALAGGARTGFGFGVIVLTRPDVLSPPTQAALEAHRSGIYGMTVFGGSSAVSPATYTALQEAIGL